MKKFLRIIVFILLLAIGLRVVNGAVRPNEDRDGIWVTYKRLPKNSIDVLLTGSSKIHANINPVVMWHTAGFTSYDISGSSMDLTTMYYYLREAFKTQHPKVVVIDILLLSDPGTTLSDVQMRNIMNMPLGLNKLGATSSAAIPATSKEKVFFPFEQYHSRALTEGALNKDSLLGKNFAQELSNIFMGYRYLSKSKPLKADTEVATFNSSRFERHYKELKKSLNFLEQQKCKVLLINAPSNQLNYLKNYESALESRNRGGYTNISYLWSQEYSTAFIIDHSSEILDSNHLNAKGAERFSQYFATYLINSYPGINACSENKLEIQREFTHEYKRYDQFKWVNKNY